MGGIVSTLVALPDGAFGTWHTVHTSGQPVATLTGAGCEILATHQRCDYSYHDGLVAAPVVVTDAGRASGLPEDIPTPLSADWRDGQAWPWRRLAPAAADLKKLGYYWADSDPGRAVLCSLFGREEYAHASVSGAYWLTDAGRGAGLTRDDVARALRTTAEWRGALDLDASLDCSRGPRLDLPLDAISLLARYGVVATTVHEILDHHGRPPGTHGRVVVCYSERARECYVHLDGVLAIRVRYAAAGHCMRWDASGQLRRYPRDTLVHVLSRAALHAQCVLRGRERRETRHLRRAQHIYAVGLRDAAVDALARGEILNFVDGQEGGRVLYRGVWYSARGLARTLMERTGLTAETTRRRPSDAPDLPDEWGWYLYAEWMRVPGATCPSGRAGGRRPRRMGSVESEVLDSGALYV